MAAVLITNNINPAVALIAAVLSGALAGCVTALIHTRLGVNDLFAGILTSTGLYSITLRLMDRSNIPLIGLDFGLDSDADWALALSLVVLGLIALLALLLATD